MNMQIAGSYLHNSRFYYWTNLMFEADMNSQDEALTAQGCLKLES